MVLPKSYTRAVFTSPGSPITLEDAPLTLPEPGEILVKVLACGVCFSDTMTQHNVMGGGFPFVPGHEIIGAVAAIPEGEKRWKIGDRVGAGWHGGHDGTCKACQKGLNQMCVNAEVNGETRSGGYAQYTLLSPQALVPIPPSIHTSQLPEYAPLLCAGTSVFNALRRCHVSPGDVVAVIGIGGLGHLAIQYAAKFGHKVVAISRGKEKEEIARSLGASEFIDMTDEGMSVRDRLQKLGGASAVLVTTPSVEEGVIDELVGGLGVLGRVVFLSVPGKITVNTGTMLHNGTSVQVWPSGQALDSEEAIAFSEMAGVKCLIETFPLSRANDAFNAMVSGKVRFRAVISMD